MGLKVFENPEFGAVRAVEMEGEPWFVGKDVVEALGYSNTKDALSILSYCPGITATELDVLSMYDGMACGHLALDKLGAHIMRYRATEIDKYAIKTACHNFPDIQQLGDAFQVREPGWT